MTETRLTYCRLCAGRCGLEVDVEPGDKRSGERIVAIRGDRAHPMTSGYACIKGLQSGELHHGESRLVQPLERQPDGSFQSLPVELALDRIAVRLQDIRERHGADAIATFRGTQHYNNSTAFHMLSAFIRALGTRSRFSTMTIDQSAKWVADGRLGVWAAGRQRFEDADVWMFVGNNPLVSLQGVNGFPPLNPTRRLKAARERGMKIIVIDPRRTETAHFADIHLQLLPGEDPTLMAGLLHIILGEGWHDREFCQRHADGVEELQSALQRFTPDYVSRRAGVAADQLYAAARLFAQESNRGIAATGTGPDMVPRSNLAEHLVEALNVVCGRFTREGEVVANPGAMSPRREVRAEVIAPGRSWEGGRKSRVRNLGMIMGEKMSGVLADEILEPGEGQIKALIIDGGNPVNALPERARAKEAMQALDLLVCIDPYLSETAQLAHYVISPTMMFERPDLPLLFEKTIYPEPFAQYTDAIIAKPGLDVVEDWYVYWALARRMGLELVFDGEPLNMTTPTSTEQLLQILMRRAQVPLDTIREYPRGKVFELEPVRVSGAKPERQGNRFQLAAEDIVAELAEVAAEPPEHNFIRDDHRYGFRLSVRRSRTVINTTYRQTSFARKRMPGNPLWMHPDDIEAQGLVDGETVILRGAHGELRVILEADNSVRPQTVSICHGWGGSGGSVDTTIEIGVAINDIIPAGDYSEPINGMPWFSAMPVDVVPLGKKGSAGTTDPSKTRSKTVESNKL
jgi:anaerobic selenocysteine-containing dehydrogenase